MFNMTNILITVINNYKLNNNIFDILSLKYLQ